MTLGNPNRRDVLKTVTTLAAASSLAGVGGHRVEAAGDPGRSPALAKVRRPGARPTLALALAQTGGLRTPPERRPQVWACEPWRRSMPDRSSTRKRVRASTKERPHLEAPSPMMENDPQNAG
jgi:hypothetical protein